MSEKIEELQELIDDARDAIEEIEDMARDNIRQLERAIEEAEDKIEELDAADRKVRCMPALREWAVNHGLIPI